jgi:serine/threonine protein kinase
MTAYFSSAQGIFMQPGTRIGPYEVVEMLGKGGSATVYKAYHSRLDRHVAIKVLHTAFVNDPHFLTRFEREARIVARLEHPAIVPIYDYDELEGSPYLVMKYVEGATLKQRAIKKGFSLGQIADVLGVVADALDYAHGRGVLHRDLKPSNILIDADDKPYLTDFGLARMAQLGESTISHDMMLGTPYYISPEQAQGSKDLTSATDIYSLGVILYELVTGSVPFSADSAYAIVHGHITTQPTPPSQLNNALPTRVDAVLLRALAKNPAQRYPTATALIQDFRQAIIEGDVSDSVPAVRYENPPAQSNRPQPAPEAADSAAARPRQQVETVIDLGNMDWSDIGRRIKDKATEWASRIEEQVDSEIARRNGISQDDPEEAIRKRVQKRLKERDEFIGHLAVYIIVNIMMWAFFFIITDTFPFWMLFVTGGWGIGIFGHGYEYYTKYGPGAARRNREIQAEVERELAARPSKRKNELELEVEPDALNTRLGMRLTEDGALTDSFVAERYNAEHQREEKRRAR